MYNNPQFISLVLICVLAWPLLFLDELAKYGLILLSSFNLIGVFLSFVLIILSEA